MKNIAIFVALSLGCTACTSRAPIGLYEGAPTTVPSSTVTFTKGYETIVRGPGSQEYVLFDNPNCDDAHRAAVFAYMRKGKVRSIPLESGRKRFITATTSYFITTNITPAGNGAIYTMGGVPCSETVSFTPAAGRSYTVSQWATLGKCKLNILDDATQSAPSDLAKETNIQCTPVEPPKSGLLTFGGE